MKQELSQLREKIDEIDEKILSLLNQRAKHVINIGKLKNRSGKAFYVPEREVKLLRSILKKNKGPFQAPAVESIFRQILSASLALESPLKIAYFGPEGTYTHIAALKKFGASGHFSPQTNIRQVFEEVLNQRADVGIIPIENSTEGIVSQTLDLFVEFDLKICGETQVRIHHNLISKQKELSKITQVFSHAQALAQCRDWLRENLPKAECIPVDSTSRAAQMAAERKNTAAISSDYAAQLHKIPILHQNIEDLPYNFTRFVIIGDFTPAPTGHDKTTLVFSTKDQPGSLFHFLKPFADHQINLTALESRPLRRQIWEYLFFVDLDGHIENLELQKAIAAVEPFCHFMKILGSYPKETEK